MPNWVSNRVKMEGIENLPLYMDTGEELVFDFNKLIPMPESLNVTEGSIKEIAKECYRRRNKQKPEMEDGEYEQSLSLYEDESSEEALAKLGKKYITNKEKYGHETWYNWCCENWGTKWNACNLATYNTNDISFETAWSYPAGIFNELGRRYPDRKIEIWYADEGDLMDSGYGVFEDGKWTITESENEEEGNRNYAIAWGYDKS